MFEGLSGEFFAISERNRSLLIFPNVEKMSNGFTLY